MNRESHLQSIVVAKESTPKEQENHVFEARSKALKWSRKTRPSETAME